MVAPGGRILWGDELLVVFAREILARRPGAVVISEVKCSQRLFDDVAKHGGKPIMWKAGHSLIKAKMRETDAAVGGEMSGHMFFADRFLGTTSDLRVVPLLDILAQPAACRSARGLPPRSTREIRVDCRQPAVVTGRRDAARRATRERWTAASFADGWPVRASNTQSALVVAEVSNATTCAQHRAFVERIVAEERPRSSWRAERAPRQLESRGATEPGPGRQRVSSSGIGTRTVNVEPTPGVLSTMMLPFRRSTSWRTM